jgi:hypothetical protein
MRVADPVMSSIPAATIDAQAVASSAVASAFLPSHNKRTEANDAFKILGRFSLSSDEKTTRRELNEVTELLTSLNKISKRDELETRQLGLVKSVPEAAGQILGLTEVAESLPIKRSEEEGMLGGLGGLGGVLGGSVKRDAEDSSTKKPTYTEKALSGFRGVLHDPSKDHKQKEEPSATESLGLAKRGSGDPLSGIESLVSGLGIIGKRDGNPLDILSSATELLGILRKREGDEGDDPLDDLDDLTSILDTLRKRDGLEIDGEMIKQLGEHGALSKRQLDIVSALATSSLSNAGAAAGALAQFATGKHRRDGGDADATTTAALEALSGLGKGKQEATGPGEGTGASSLADEFLAGQTGAEDATNALEGFSESPSKGTAKGQPLGKRQVPPIAGADALSVVKGLLANPGKAVKPVTEGILIGGKSLEDMGHP